MNYNNKEARKLLAQLNAMNQKKARKKKIVAESKIDEARKKKEEQRVEKVKKLAGTLTRNLPECDINPNQDFQRLRNQIAGYAFLSALENGVLFKNVGEHSLHIIKGKENLYVKADDLREQSPLLVKWAGFGHKLIDDKGRPYDHYALYHGLRLKASLYKADQEKRKSSNKHFSEIVDAMALSKFVYKPESNRETLLNQLTTQVVNTNKRLEKDFSRDMSGNLYLRCSDSQSGRAKLLAKDIIPYFQQIIDNSPISGRLKSSHDATSLMDGFRAKQPRQ